MATHTNGYKYILSASISNEVGSILEERNKLHGVIKSFEVEQALRQYYGLDDDYELKNVEGLKAYNPIAQPPPCTLRVPPTRTSTSTHAGTLEVDNLTNMATTEGSRRGGLDVNEKVPNSLV
jgi:hypothetical protein